MSLGAAEIISREEFLIDVKRTLLKQRWQGVIDTVGGTYLETAIKSTKYGGSVTCCGLVASDQLNLTVFPFILRGVNLLGIDSVNISQSLRQEIWKNLADIWKPYRLADLAKTVKLSELDTEIDLILAGKQTGRIVVDLWK